MSSGVLTSACDRAKKVNASLKLSEKTRTSPVHTQK